MKFKSIDDQYRNEANELVKFLVEKSKEWIESRPTNTIGFYSHIVIIEALLTMVMDSAALLLSDGTCFDKQSLFSEHDLLSLVNIREDIKDICSGVN
jgi:hypothetical protein